VITHLATTVPWIFASIASRGLHRRGPETRAGRVMPSSRCIGRSAPLRPFAWGVAGCDVNTLRRGPRSEVAAPPGAAVTAAAVCVGSAWRGLDRDRLLRRLRRATHRGDVGLGQTSSLPTNLLVAGRHR